MIKILNSLCYAIIAINTQKQVLFINKYLLDLLELNEDDVIGKNLFQVISVTNQPMDDLINNFFGKNMLYFHVKNKKNITYSLCGELIEDDFKGENAYFLIGKKQYDKPYPRKKIDDFIINGKKFDKIHNSLVEFINTSEDMITTWDLYGNPIYNNYKLSNILGFNSTDKLNFFDILYPDDKEQILNMMFNDRHDFGCVTSRFRCSDNSYKWIDWNYKILRDENIFFFSGRDVSDRIANEKRKLLVEQAQYIEKIKDEFLANITHEFRTPINVIIGTIQLINSSLENNNYKLEDLNEHIKYLKRNSNRLLRLVNNLIDITYIKNGYHELNMKNYNIVELIENVCNTVIENKENDNINIIFDTNCEEIIMACDANEIERIILNLLSNAIKYSFTKEPIIVSITSSTNKIKISVKDHGIGIPKDYLNEVFEKLTKVDNNFTRNNEGSGIGLTIVKSLVDLHNGTIKVESELGKGSNFIITLPINIIKEDDKINIEKSCDFKNKIEKCAMEFSDIYAYN